VHGVGTKLSAVPACPRDGGWSLATVASHWRRGRRHVASCLRRFLVGTCCPSMACLKQCSGCTGRPLRWLEVESHRLLRPREVQSEWRKTWRHSARCEWGKISWLLESPSQEDKDERGCHDRHEIWVRGQHGTSVRGMPRICLGGLTVYAGRTARAEHVQLKPFANIQSFFQLLQLLQAQKCKT
jgi:hypothetical protein